MIQDYKDYHGRELGLYQLLSDAITAIQRTSEWVDDSFSIVPGSDVARIRGQLADILRRDKELAKSVLHSDDFECNAGDGWSVYDGCCDVVCEPTSVEITAVPVDHECSQRSEVDADTEQMLLEQAAKAIEPGTFWGCVVTGVAAGFLLGLIVASLIG